MPYSMFCTAWRPKTITLPPAHPAFFATHCPRLCPSCLSRRRCHRRRTYIQLFPPCRCCFFRGEAGEGAGAGTDGNGGGGELDRRE